MAHTHGVRSRTFASVAAKESGKERNDMIRPQALNNGCFSWQLRRQREQTCFCPAATVWFKQAALSLCAVVWHNMAKPFMAELKCKRTGSPLTCTKSGTKYWFYKGLEIFDGPHLTDQQRQLQWTGRRGRLDVGMWNRD